MHQRLLIIHPSPMIRGLFRKYVLSEFTQFEVVESEEAGDAVNKLTHESFSLVISGNQMKGLEGVTLFKVMRSSKFNSDTPFLLATSSQDGDDSDEFRQAGIDPVMQLPITAKQLSEKIHQLINFRQRRATPRYTPDQVQLQLKFEGATLPAQLINISRSSLSADLQINSDEIHFLPSLYLNLTYQKDGQSIEIEDIWCKLRQVTVLNWNDDFRAQQLRVVWEFLDIPEVALPLWEDLFSGLAEEFRRLEQLHAP